MIKKMSLEEFRQIKAQLGGLIKVFELKKADENYDDSILINKYLKTQNYLLQYDLSDIPFEEWKGIEIISDDTNKADFSKTRANLDFNLFEYYGNVNFKGCNVKNLERLKNNLNPNNFDEETIIANSTLFLSDSFSDEFKEKYYSGNIRIVDLVSLSSQQLDEIKQKDLKSHMDYKEHTSLLMKIFDIDKIIQLYLHSPKEYDAVNKIIYMHSLDSESKDLKNFIKYFELFGEEKGIKLVINRTETVNKMIELDQVELMKNWYDKTGGKFIPDFVVMQNFSLDEADKFLESGSNWSNLMRIPSFAKKPESRAAMLKLAYSFGAFDQDQRGFKKLQDLLTGLPKKIDSEQGYIIDRVDKQIDQYSKRKVFYHNISITDVNGNRTIESPNMTLEEKEKAYNKMIEYVKNNKFIDLMDTPSLVNLLETLKNEKLNIDFSKPIFSQLYKKNEDGSYTLNINPQSCPKSAQATRGILEKFRELLVLSPDKAHQLFGSFELKYDSDFREFLLANMDNIMKNTENASLVGGIQRQFSDIKVANSNRTLTWDLAVSYVQENKFKFVNVGNERVADISAVAGYTQADFYILQQIYNYGKQRTFSSIPRIKESIEKRSGRYTYEILRLDDPLALSVGTESNCCQELNNDAELCMEHSMVDKNGRVFVIKDEEGNITAQSWVWRNKDVLCFDNIEIPYKAFERVGKENQKLGRKEFSDEVFAIYKQAAHELIEEDEKVYKELLESGKITQEQYNGLRLGKITVGLGWNDIAKSLKENSKLDKGNISRPLPFEPPVKLVNSFYTKDSITQYILEEREDRKEYDGETLAVHSDDYVEYNDDNFTEKLNNLENVTKEDSLYLDTSVRGSIDSKHLVTEIAKNYDLNPDTSRIIMSSNFAIIYDVNGDKLKIGDLLFNTKVDNKEQQMDIESKVVIQLRLALEQIASDKEIDVSQLDEKQKKMYAKVIGLTDEMDIERGVGHAK